MNNLPLWEIIQIWQHQLLDRTELATQGGELIRIIYQGRINDDRGADLQDVVIATSGELIKGDVEVHIKSSTWQAVPQTYPHHHPHH